MVEASFAAGCLDTRSHLGTHRLPDVASRRRSHTEDGWASIDLEDFARYSRALDGRSYGYKVLKRLFDLLVATLVIVVGLVPGFLLAFFIWRSTGGSPIYRQTRVGLYGKRFRIYKFRTMVADSDDVEKYFTLEQLEAWKRERKVDDDPRITWLGKILRATSIDELPNFVNVFLGQMSTVGPRAISVEEMSCYGSDAQTLASVHPGITGWWQVKARNNANYEDGGRQKLEMEYVRNASAWLDLKICLLTFRSILDKTGR